MHIIENQLVDYQKSAELLSPTIDLAAIKQYLQEQVYANVAPEYNITSRIKNNCQKLQNEVFSQQLICLLGKSIYIATEEDTADKYEVIEGKFFQLAKTLGIKHPKNNNHPAHQLSNRLIEHPELLFIDINTPEEQTNAKQQLSRIKKDLEIIYYLAQAKILSTNAAATKSIIQNLFTQLNVCLHGLMSTLTIIKTDLMQKDMHQIMAGYRLTLIEEYKDILVAQYLHDANIYYEDLDIHLLTNLIRYADQQHFKINASEEICNLNDNFGMAVELDKTKQQQFIKQIQEHYTLENFINYSVSQFKYKFSAAAKNLHINITNQTYVSQEEFANLESFTLSTLKELGFIDGGQTELPNNILSVVDNFYDELSSYTVENTQSTSIIKANTIYIEQKIFEQKYTLKFIAPNHQLYGIKVDSTFMQAHSDKEQLIFAIANKICLKSVANLDYFLINNLYKNKESLHNFKTYQIANGIKIHLNRYGSRGPINAIYIEESGQLQDLSTYLYQNIDNLHLKLTTHLENVQQEILNYCVLKQHMDLLEKIIATINIDAMPWAIEMLYNIAAQANKPDIIKWLLDKNINLNMPSYAYYLSVIDPLSPASLMSPRKNLMRYIKNKNLTSIAKIIIQSQHCTLEDLYALSYAENLLNFIIDELSQKPPIFISSCSDEFIELLFIKSSMHGQQKNKAIFKKLLILTVYSNFKACLNKILTSNISFKIAMNLKYLINNINQYTHLMDLNFSGAQNTLTPLLFFALNQDMQSILGLLALGANPQIKIYENKNILSYKNITNDVLELLKNPVKYALTNSDTQTLALLIKQPKYEGILLNPKNKILEASIQTQELAKIRLCVKSILTTNKPNNRFYLNNLLQQILDIAMEQQLSTNKLKDLALILQVFFHIPSMVQKAICNMNAMLYKELVKIKLITPQLILRDIANTPEVYDSNKTILNYILEYTNFTNIMEMAILDACLTKKILPHCINSYSDTPLHIAAKNNLSNAIVRLIPLYKSLNFKNADGETALDLAVSCNNLEIAKLLKQRNKQLIKIGQQRNQSFKKQRLI
jgi:ankyrin repeat protein